MGRYAASASCTTRQGRARGDLGLTRSEKWPCGTHHCVPQGRLVAQYRSEHLPELSGLVRRAELCDSRRVVFGFRDTEHRAAAPEVIGMHTVFAGVEPLALLRLVDA